MFASEPSFRGNLLLQNFLSHEETRARNNNSLKQ